MRRWGQKPTAGTVGSRTAAVIAFDVMWTYQQARRRGRRQNLWVWTAVVSDTDGSRWADFELGDRRENTFLRLYERLPEAEPAASTDEGYTKNVAMLACSPALLLADWPSQPYDSLC